MVVCVWWVSVRCIVCVSVCVSVCVCVCVCVAGLSANKGAPSGNKRMVCGGRASLSPSCVCVYGVKP